MNPRIILVHGGFVDGSGWQPVYRLLRKRGYDVAIVQNPTVSLAGDVAATKLVLDKEDRPAILVGHSYGGAVITEAGNETNVAGLVYICAFVPDGAESVQTLIGKAPQGAAPPPLLPPRDGFLFLDRARFHAAFAGDLDADTAAFMADAQVPWGVGALGGTLTQAAWRSKPSWYLVTTEDRMIPPELQRGMAKRADAKVTEAAGSHAIYISQPDVVADFIAVAAKSNALAA
jgi:pimeloyl-ACP methyl ester carboxylesterase